MADPEPKDPATGAVFAVLQHQGRRPYQEDQIGYQDNGDVEQVPPTVIALADGMGGHVGGREAATLAVSTFLDHAASSGAETIRNRQLKALEAANQSIRDKVESEPDFSGMGCTLIGLSVVEGKVRWVSVGDSPLWLVDGSMIQRLNEDHSMAGAYKDMVAAGEMTPDEARAAPNRNALRSALSGGSMDMIDCPEDWVQLPSGSTLIAASDGLDTLQPEEIVKLVRDGPRDATALVQTLIDEVLKRDRPKQDNVTVAVLLAPESSSSRTATERTTLVKTKTAAVASAEAASSAKTVPAAPSSKLKKIALPAIILVLLALIIGAVMSWLFSGNDAPDPQTEETEISAEPAPAPTSPDVAPDTDALGTPPSETVPDAFEETPNDAFIDPEDVETGTPEQPENLRGTLPDETDAGLDDTDLPLEEAPSDAPIQDSEE